MAIEKGDFAPDFSLQSTDGDVFTLSEELKKKPVLINFYVGDFGINCTNYLTKFSERVDEINSFGVTVVGINPDKIDSHINFKNRVGVPWELLYDEDQKISKAYGAIVGPGHMVTGYTNREFILVGMDGKVLWTWKADIPKTLPEVDAVLDGLKTSL